MNEDLSQHVVSTTLNGRVLTVALNRPQVHNAMNPHLIREVTRLFGEIGEREDVRVVILTGNGRSFCAGADLAEMRAAADYDFQQNAADGQAIFDLMLAVDRCPKPVVGRINGAAFGGGVGLVSCCDSVVAVERAGFAFSEVRLGLVPAVISPFVVSKIGAGNARELFLSGERFDAAKALRIGLVHHLASEEKLDALVAERVDEFLQGAPGAQAAAKRLVQDMLQAQTAEELRCHTADLLAKCRASDEGREGMSAFLEKRRPDWQRG